ncbi:hypothetical protein [Streptomyces sp. XH2]|uniref:hypothetical protein n=1 Tax=Streptomyces sp. XH2 TaxID=3412483 RepID=UPI003C7CDAE9
MTTVRPSEQMRDLGVVQHGDHTAWRTSAPGSPGLTPIPQRPTLRTADKKVTTAVRPDAVGG